MTNFFLNTFNVANERFSSYEDEVFTDWKPLCLCPSPAKRLECMDCPHFQSKLAEVQAQLHPMPNRPLASPIVSFPPPPLVNGYPIEFRQRVLDLYSEGHTLAEISTLCDGVSEATIRRWARNTGLPKRDVAYSLEVKDECFALFKEGKNMEEIAKILGISVRTASAWISHAGLSQTHIYSPQIRAICIKMYRENLDIPNIVATTGVHQTTLRKWLKKENIYQSRQSYSPEVKQRCLELVMEGMDAKEISQLLNVPSKYIYAWARKVDLGYKCKLHSLDVKANCLKLYQEHRSYRKVHELTGVPKTTLQQWVKEANLPPSPNYLHQIEIRERSIELYFELKDFNAVSLITGVKSSKIRYWVKKAKFMRKVDSYSIEQQQSCLSLVEQGYDVADIQSKLNIEEDVIQFWIKNSKPVSGYSPEVRQQCLELYQAGFTHRQIFELTGVSSSSIIQWKEKANLQRPRCYSSTRMKQACLYLYQKMGKSHDEIMAFMKVSKEFLDKVILDAMSTH